MNDAQSTLETVGETTTLAFRTILEFGLLGALFSISLIANAVLIWRLIACYRSHHKDSYDHWGDAT